MKLVLQRLGILLSGRGSNFLAIAEAIRTGGLRGCEIAVVISNVADAPGLKAASELGFKTVAVPSRGMSREEHDLKMAEALRKHTVDYVILAGYMRVLSPEFLRAFPDRVLNIHPSLLPAFPGLHAQQQALEYGAGLSGCTVHFVDDAVDHGVIVLQKAVAIEDGDTVTSLSERVLAQEHIAYSEGIARVLSGHYLVEGRRYVLRKLRDRSL